MRPAMQGAPAAGTRPPRAETAAAARGDPQPFRAQRELMKCYQNNRRAIVMPGPARSQCDLCLLRRGSRFQEVVGAAAKTLTVRSEAHTSELQSLMRLPYAVFWLKNKKQQPDQGC